MKIATALLLVTFAASAHAELLAPKGATAQLKVEYVFTSAGNYTSSSKDQINRWNVRRVINLTARYAADAPQAFGSMHANDPQQQKEIKSVQTRAASVQKKMEPTMNDMMKIAEGCGISMENTADVSKAEEKAQEACVEKAVANYGLNMEVTPDMKSASAEATAITKTVTATRFQLWRATSQSGTYSIDEEHHHQVFEMTCTNTKVCRRDDIRKGSGNVPAPPGGKSVAGLSMLEVDSANKNMVITLPMPLAPLPYTQTVTTTIPDEKGGTKQAVASPWMSQAAQPLTVSIPGNAGNVSGTKTYPVKGTDGEGGTLTVNWQFTRQ